MGAGRAVGAGRGQWGWGASFRSCQGMPAVLRAGQCRHLTAPAHPAPNTRRYQQRCGCLRCCGRANSRATRRRARRRRSSWACTRSTACLRTRCSTRCTGCGCRTPRCGVLLLLRAALLPVLLLCGAGDSLLREGWAGLAACTWTRGVGAAEHFPLGLSHSSPVRPHNPAGGGERVPGAALRGGGPALHPGRSGEGARGQAVAGHERLTDRLVHYLLPGCLGTNALAGSGVCGGAVCGIEWAFDSFDSKAITIPPVTKQALQEQGCQREAGAVGAAARGAAEGGAAAAAREAGAAAAARGAPLQ